MLAAGASPRPTEMYDIFRTRRRGRPSGGPNVRYLKLNVRAARCTAPTEVYDDRRSHRRGGFPSLPAALVILSGQALAPI